MTKETLTEKCDLSEYCRDLHSAKVEFCEGRKNYKECPYYINEESANFGSPLIR